jgi:hypothetical protein
MEHGEPVFPMTKWNYGMIMVQRREVIPPFAYPLLIEMRRYAVVLDPQTPAGGPTEPVLPGIAPSPAFSPILPQTERVVSVAETSGRPGDTVGVSIELASQGDENALGVSLNFDTAVLTYGSAALGADATGGVLLVNESQSATGRLGIGVALNPGETFSTGTCEVAVVEFVLAADTTSASTEITFGDEPIARQVVDANAHALSATYSSGLVKVTYGLEVSAPYKVVGIPYEGTGIGDAQSLVQSVPNCTAAWAWDAVSQTWSGYEPGGANNFAVVPGGAYLVEVTATGTFECAGTAWATPLFGLGAGYNLITLPKSKEAVTTAEALAQDIPNCTAVWRWDAETQTWNGHPTGGPNNFAVEVGLPYLIHVSAEGMWP